MTANLNTNNDQKTGIIKTIQQSNNRERNVKWFNPPYSKHVETNIGKRFVSWLDKPRFIWTGDPSNLENTQ